MTTKRAGASGDRPFTRESVCNELKPILVQPIRVRDHRRVRSADPDTVALFNKTVILITHDIDEAVALSKRVVVLSGRPALVKAEHAIAIDWRTPIDARSDPRFADHFHTLCGDLDIQARKDAA